MTVPPQWTARVRSVLFASAGLFLLLCLLTYRSSDIGLLSSHPQRPTENLGGAIGAWIGFFGRGGFGWASLLLPLLCLLWARRLWQAGQGAEIHVGSLMVATTCLLTSLGTLLAFHGGADAAQTEFGGLIGFLLARSGRYYLGTAGTVLTALCIGLLSWLVVSGQTLRATGLDLLRRVADLAGSFMRRPATLGPSVGKPHSVAAAADAKLSARPRADAPSAATIDEELQGNGGAEPRVRIRSTVQIKTKKVPSPSPRQAPSGFQLPPLDLLVSPPPVAERQLAEDLQANARVLEETLREFGVEATVVNIDRGPTITRYELTPAPGVKLTKIVSLADDLALVLKSVSCHIVAPIPGKGRVGVDVPNNIMTTVYLKEIVATHEFQGHLSPIILPIGKDVSGHAILTDLRECPHLLIAGTTGSGKTVCLNSLLVGILTHASPEQVKFLMIDPKMVELAMFNNIPHLIAPVVTNAKKASVALHWAVREMERRYQLFAEAAVRNIVGYNARVASGYVPKTAPAAEGEEPQAADEPGAPLPYIVIVIDELADLMMVASQDVEGAIVRLAQLSRAVGLHMILATQRPSVDVITGVIKANFPARIAFQVASKVDSRTILDMNGADKLVGRGDLLFLRPGTAKPIRAQGAFLTDAEIERVTDYLKQQRAPVFDQRLIEHQSQPEGTMLGGEKDEMYETAKQLVLDAGQASTSLLQRRLRLGYGRAARILDLMEQEGLVGPPQGSRPREVLVSRDAAGRGASHT